MNEKKVGTKVLLKSGFWYTASSFLTRAMVFLTMPFFTRILTNEQYGDFSVFTSWMATLIIICGLETYSTINRARFDFTGEGELDSYISSALGLSTLFTMLLFAAYLLFPTLFHKLFLIERRYMWIMFAHFFTYPAFSMFQAKQRIEYKYKLSAGIAFTLLALSYLISIALTVYMKEDRLLGRILGQYILYILFGFGFYLLFLQRGRTIKINYWGYALRMGVPLVFAYLGSQILLSSDSIVVKHMCSAQHVSYLALTHSCSHIVLLLVRSVNTAWAPWFFDMLNNGRIMLIRKAFQIYLWTSIAITFVLVLIGPEIVLILGGEKYRESIYIFPAYTLCGIFTVLTAQFTNLETYRKKPEYTAIFTGIAAILNVVLNIVGVKIWDYRAVCYATLICQLILIGLHYLFTLRLGIRELLPVKKMMLSLAVSLLMIPMGLLLYQNNYIRYIFIMLVTISLIICVIIKRDGIKKLVFKYKEMS